MVFRHQIPQKTYLINGYISNITSDGIRLDSGDKSLQPQQIELTNFTIVNTKNRYQSFINVLENSEISVKDSQFSNCVSFENGAVMRGKYTGSKI